MQSISFLLHMNARFILNSQRQKEARTTVANTALNCQNLSELQVISSNLAQLLMLLNTEIRASTITAYETMEGGTTLAAISYVDLATQMFQTNNNLAETSHAISEIVGDFIQEIIQLNEEPAISVEEFIQVNDKIANLRVLTNQSIAASNQATTLAEEYLTRINDLLLEAKEKIKKDKLRSPLIN
ncbi:hypothetical protein ACFE04_002143 [Oxalis oulophora]